MLNSGASGDGVLAVLHFKVIQEVVETKINLQNIVLVGPNPPTASPSDPHPQISPSSTSSTAEVTFSLGNRPIPDVGEDRSVTEDTPIVFNGTRSQFFGDNATYTWSFMDGTLKNLDGPIVTYTFEFPGEYPVTLTIQDSLGSGNRTVIITVLDTTTPIAKMTLQSATSNQTFEVGQQITFSAAGSYDPENGTIARYFWDLGKEAQQKFEEHFIYAYTSPGSYMVTLTVYDSANNNATITQPVTIVGDQIAEDPNQANFNLPPTIVYILILLTILALGGSGFWLTKRT
jgi:PKD repeat protein